MRHIAHPVQPIARRSPTTDRRVGSVSGASGQDSDAVEAVDLDDLVGPNEMEVLATRGFSALGTSDPEHLDVAAVNGDVVAGTNMTSKGHLGWASLRRAMRHGHSLLWCDRPLQSLVHTVAALGRPAPSKAQNAGDDVPNEDDGAVEAMAVTNARCAHTSASGPPGRVILQQSRLTEGRGAVDTHSRRVSARRGRPGRPSRWRDGVDRGRDRSRAER